MCVLTIKKLMIGISYRIGTLELGMRAAVAPTAAAATPAGVLTGPELPSAASAAPTPVAAAFASGEMEATKAT